MGDSHVNFVRLYDPRQSRSDRTRFGRSAAATEQTEVNVDERKQRLIDVSWMDWVNPSSTTQLMNGANATVRVFAPKEDICCTEFIEILQRMRIIIPLLILSTLKANWC